MAKKISLLSLRHFLKGILDGTIEIHLREDKRKKKSASKNVGRPKKVTKRHRGRPRKPGRKPMSITARINAIERAKRKKLREARKRLPTPRQIFLALYGKTEGLKLTALAKEFNAPRNLLKNLLTKLVKKEDLTEVKGVYYLKRRIRKGKKSITATEEEKTPPIKPEQVLSYLKTHPGSTLVEMTRALGAKNYQKLNKVVKTLKDQKKIIVNGKAYSLASPE